MKKIIYLTLLLSTSLVAQVVSVTWDSETAPQNIFFKPMKSSSDYRGSNEKVNRNLYPDGRGRQNSQQNITGIDIEESMISIFGGCLPQGDPSLEWQCVDDFLISATEVTNSEYALFNPQKKYSNAQAPVTNISLSDAKNYATWLSNKTGQNYQLPNNNEWKYAASAGQSGGFFGNDVCSYANISMNCDTTSVVSVALYNPNPWGLHDVIGNVWEMVDEDSLIVKGGSWLSSRADINIDHRPISSSSDDVGFRLIIRK